MMNQLVERPHSNAEREAQAKHHLLVSTFDHAVDLFTQMLLYQSDDYARAKGWRLQESTRDGYLRVIYTPAEI